jgi:hypothetical protein
VKRLKKRYCVKSKRSWASNWGPGVFFRRYECLTGDAYPNVKHIYYTRIDRLAAELTVHEGQRLAAIDCAERYAYRFANVLGTILEDFVAASLWPSPVDNSFRDVTAK